VRRRVAFLAWQRLRHCHRCLSSRTQAFQNIDRPLADSILRWREALARTDKPFDVSMFSTHWELAQVMEFRDEFPLAAEQFEVCYLTASLDRSPCSLPVRDSFPIDSGIIHK
jgi:hypothetical protein